MSEVEQAQEPEVVGPGALLKQAREKNGLTLDDMAKKLHLKAVAIASLEADDYDDNISLTFTKGYIKLYAKHIGVSEQKVLDAFDKLNTKEKEPAKLQSFSRRVAKQASDDRLMLVTYLIVGAVVAMVVVWWWQQSSSETTALPAESGVSSSTASPRSAGENTVAAAVNSDINTDPADVSAKQSNAPLNEVLNSAEPEQVLVAAERAAESLPITQQPDEIELQSTGTSDVPININSAETDVASANVEEVLAEAGDLITVDLEFTFGGDCWMNLTDSTGEAIAYGVKKSGRVMPVSGVPPFEVTLGAPEVVQIRYDGVAVDMTRFDAGKTAKFTLPFTS